MATYDVQEATTWPVNELGEIVVQAGKGTNTITGQLPSEFTPIDIKSGRVVFAGLPALLQPQTFAALGDSITFNNSTNSASAKYKNWIGYMSVAEMLHPAINFPIANNFGVNSDTTTLMLNRLPAVLAAKPTWCVFLGGTNDLTGDPTTNAFTTITNNIQTVYDTLSTAGIKLILCTILPRAIWSGRTAPEIVIARNNMLRVNAWIRNFCAQNKGVLLCDWYTDFVDPNSATNDPVAGFTYDLLHPSPIGAYWMGKKFVRVVTPYLPSIDTFDLLASGQYDLYDAALNPTGNLLVNPMLTGTTGTVSGTGASTSAGVATSWNVGRSVGSNGTCVGTIDTQNNPTGQPIRRQVMTCAHSAGTNNEVWQLTQTVNATSKFATGDFVQGVVRVDITGISNVNFIKAMLHDNNGVANVQAGAALNESSGFKIPDGITETFYFKTPRELQISAYSGSGTQATTFRLQVGLDATTTASATVAVSRPSFRKVT